MAVRLVIGRAGTGKTALCVREIRAQMAADPLGPALLWITPEQATFSAERAILTEDTAGSPNLLKRRGTFRAQVLSLRRLALLMAREAGLGEGRGTNAELRVQNSESGAVGAAVAPAVAKIGGGKPLDDVARLVMLEEVVRRERGNLTVFASFADRPGFIAKLDGTLKELRQHGHSGRSLRDLVDRPSGGAAPASPMDAVMRRKLMDLGVLLDAWAQVVEQPDAWDFEYLMHQAALNMGKSKLIAGARVWVDAISAMSTLEMRMLVGLGQYAEEVTMTLLADPDSPGMRQMRLQPGAAAGENFGVFARTERLHRRLIDAFRKHDVELGKTVTLRKAYRFGDEAVGRVEMEMFNDEIRMTNDEADAKRETRNAKQGGGLAGGLFEGLETVEVGGVEIWESSDPETEVRMAAQAIREMVVGAGRGLRYRQIAVIVPELEAGGGGGAAGYQDAVRRIFAEHGIPHFIDARRGMAHHPLVELVRTAVAVVRSHFDRDEMLLLLKTQLAGVGDGDVAMVENYVVEHGITHVAWDRPWRWMAPNQREGDVEEGAGGVGVVPASVRRVLERVNEVRGLVWGELVGFVEAMRDDEETGRRGDKETREQGDKEMGEGAGRYARALRELLVTLNVEKQIDGWIDGARGAGQAELAQIHEQAWRQVNQLLALLETILTGRQRTLAEFERLLGTALQGLTLGLIPPTVDQVLVSSVTRSRIPEVEVGMVLGAVEGQFPKVVPEDPILSDAERGVFNEASADPIGEGSDRQLLEMPFFDYVALTRASRKLVVSYPLADRAGKALSRSRHVARMLELLGRAGEGGVIVERRFDAASRTRVDRIATLDDLLAGVTTWAREVRVGEGEYGVQSSEFKVQSSEGVGGEEAGLMAGVYNWLVGQGDERIAAARGAVWGAIVGKGVPQLTEELAGRFYPREAPLRMSVSQLERFATCPLQYFVYYTLNLRPRVEFQVDQLSLGRLQHRILEQVYRRIMDGALGWPKCEEGALRALLEREVDVAIEEIHGEAAEQIAGYEKTRARLKRTLGITLEADRRRALAGEFRPAAVELGFGVGGEALRDGRGRLVALPVLEIRTAGGRVVHLTGKIDRMDVAEGEAPGRGGAGGAVVIDYKSASKKSVELFRLVAGISLQLPLYALVVRELAGLRPLAALYVALGVRQESVAYEGLGVAAGSDDFYQKFKPRGVIDQLGAWMLDAGVAEGGASKWYKVRFKKDGGPYKNMDVVTHEDFGELLSYTREKIGTLGDELARGEIGPLPYRCGVETLCEYCDFGSMCPFDGSRGRYREVKRKGNGEALGEIRTTNDK